MARKPTPRAWSGTPAGPTRPDCHAAGPPWPAAASRQRVQSPRRAAGRDLAVAGLRGCGREIWWNADESHAIRGRTGGWPPWFPQRTGRVWRGGQPRAMLARSFNPKTSVAAGLPSPRGSIGTSLGALTSDSSPYEVAAIIHEAHRRGHSPYQTTAILADAPQESNLSPRALSPNRLWYSIFQQDASYPGRHNPNSASSEFFNRLDRHGGPFSPNIWKPIFWLQQRPGEPSAEAAVAHGRQAYLNEIQGRQQRAENDVPRDRRWLRTTRAHLL
jgi:hypothetical protein